MTLSSSDYEFDPTPPVVSDPEDSDVLASPVAATTFDVVARRVEDGVSFAAGSVRIPMPPSEGIAATELFDVVLESVVPTNGRVRVLSSGEVCELDIEARFNPDLLPIIVDDDGEDEDRAYAISLPLLVNNRSTVSFGLDRVEASDDLHRVEISGNPPVWNSGDATPVVAVVAPLGLPRFAAFSSDHFLTFIEVDSC